MDIQSWVNFLAARPALRIMLGYVVLPALALGALIVSLAAVFWFSRLA